MKIKVKTDDFKVSEVLDLDVVHGDGKYSIYKIEKWGTNTLDVINDIAKRNSPAQDRLRRLKR